ncbi:hypothetical protein F1737_01240 [Methanoplanus sp. FWC-SCC4]|uniref:Cell surface protein n=1 Tax=Methanochimaera problematica TaxID=2609417 RepID=A0AA97I394_9EURY|nr:hypothetical protein [Methanoplanus sp. FWC-SCC4]WOF15404.1 hypothetical protein F1737_01240 [Methanoplanus sp. FWC-SCC4]
MAGFLKKLFAKKEEEPFRIEFSEIDAYLLNKEEGVMNVFREASASSGKEVRGAIADIMDKSDRLLEAKIPEDADVPPRVRSVVEKSLPGFVSSVKKTADVELSDDPELFYEEIIALVQSFGNCMRQQGRYLPAAYPEEMKDIRSSVTVIGRELNSMSEKIKPSIELRENLSKTRKVYEEIKGSEDEADSSIEERKSLKKRIISLTQEMQDTDEKISLCRKSPEYIFYEEMLAKKDSLSEEASELMDTYNLLSSTVSNVFRKAVYAAEREGNKDLAASLKKFEEILNDSKREDETELTELYESFYDSFRSLTESDGSIIKNKSEEKLFADKFYLTVEISQICRKYREVISDLNKTTGFIEDSGPAKELERLEKMREDLLIDSENDKKRINYLSEQIESLNAGIARNYENLLNEFRNLEGREVIFGDDFPGKPGF